jgi:hypothetical protein
MNSSAVQFTAISLLIVGHGGGGEGVTMALET